MMSNKSNFCQTCDDLDLETITEKGSIGDIRYPAVLAVAGKHIFLGEYAFAEQAAEAMEIGHKTIARLVIQNII